MTSRREFLQHSALFSVAGLTARAAAAAPAGFLDVRRAPDAVLVQTEQGERRLRAAGGRWEDEGITVTVAPVPNDRAGAWRVTLGAPSAAVKRVHLRWRGSLAETRLLLGDAWERGYGDLEWRGFVPDRVMPWYVAAWDGRVTHAYGVRVGARAFCAWQADAQGISLLADVRSGGAGVRLGDRALDVCDVLCRPGVPNESAFAAVHAFCRTMSPSPRLPARPVYGHNDWYWAYGKNSAATVRDDARRIVDLSPAGANRPFAVIDDGWQPGRGADKAGAGTWDRGNDKFGDMAALAAEIVKLGARPGVWIRPLQAPNDAPDAWRLPRDPRDRSTLDPSVPEVLHKVAEDVARVRGWGYELVKHDYTTFDVFGRWGFQMTPGMTRDGWTFAAGPSRTTAEVIDALYRTIRDAAGDATIIGCNTVSHLSAGRFELCRVGDDTSGTEWSRTRRMGVNTLAFRAPQHGAFYAADADCVGVTDAIPWQYNRQWLDLLARSGTPTFVSLAPDALGAAQQRDLRAALALAAREQPLGEPLDWQHTAWPTRWKLGGAEHTYDWTGPDGASAVP
jgi:alpha-galactosidase